ncbi:hypothetical protein QYM36_012639 [Artemia franciscana]|uniref:Uncharacterized protein n=1 Tax=Artemia franciscana TaxID=6661 RepID=A0AA88HPR0_ARTSF|nr:hypothetical protein QYM36_012639 [Artemia franciscana]
MEEALSRSIKVDYLLNIIELAIIIYGRDDEANINLKLHGMLRETSTYIYFAENLLFLDLLKLVNRVFPFSDSSVQDMLVRLLLAPIFAFYKEEDCDLVKNLSILEVTAALSNKASLEKCGSLSISVLEQHCHILSEKTSNSLFYILCKYWKKESNSESSLFLRIPLSCRMLALACKLAEANKNRWHHIIDHNLLMVLCDGACSHGPFNVPGVCSLLKSMGLCFQILENLNDVDNKPLTGLLEAVDFVKIRFSHPSWEVRDSAVDAAICLLSCLKIGNDILEGEMPESD